ncbi:hypothetical protein QUW38_02175 [Clostridium butyricum]|uniref:hypothetical protein n=1 Tax=Clostridium butyricum TaxID=1492 RepID=UPI0025A3306A|nr:hypothetical protein [Clostridium butyricum]MDM8130120.1 hypothetical protein [Clostridium butyricum]MDM8228247.1 hypothetical protein [Clostridium butyricum]
MKKIVIECSSCKGTGLYKGMSERENCAVVCSVCHGTGKTDFFYNEFEGRKKRTDVKRVFKNSCGYVQSDEDVTTKDGKVIKFSEGGCSYEEWLNGEEPKPVEDLYCPYVWNNTGIGHEPLNDCKEHCGFGSISNCKKYDCKEECWKKLKAYKEKLKTLEMEFISIGYTQDSIEEIKNSNSAKTLREQLENLENEKSYLGENQ